MTGLVSFFRQDETLKTVLEGCHILLYLNVSHTVITDASLRVLAQLSRWSTPCLPVSIVYVSCSCHRKCENLQYLSIAYCLNFSDHGLYFVGTGEFATRLIYLDISGCNQVPTSILIYIHTVPVHNVIAVLS